MGRKRTNKQRHLPTRVYKNRSSYYYSPRPDERHRFDGKKLVLLGKTLPEALERYDEIVVQTGTLAEVWSKYQRSAHFKNKNTERTQADKRGYWKRLKPAFGACRPDDVRPRDIYDYLDMREEEGGGVQGNREIALLSHMYTKAIRWEMAEYNPCLKLERNEENKREKVYVTDEMLAAWLKFAPKKLAIYTKLEFMIGARCSDVLHLKLSQIDEKGAGIHLRAGKTGKENIFPWNRDLRKTIRQAKAIRKNAKGVEFVSDYLFLNRFGKPYTKSGFDSLWQKAMTRFAEKGFTRFAMSDMRAKHASDLDDLGGDATKNLQHSNPAVTNRHYLRKKGLLVTLELPKS